VLIRGEKSPRNENDGISGIRGLLEVLADVKAKVVNGKQLFKTRWRRFGK
jgi:hypothetical protein